ncbi:P-loop containing nucleoside triphosphate hydrolase protein [Zychaea mexicana]|uniref:P-loop containing nucleoside triphosphate hydrolase protein n=1 Tax=Zychaea mexicana TaxID=64656 RepID=UPI0022FF3E7D|nr:P-loop containing nucleoside triphosphate hydrolase protein [Zychaea mexicana]KAI9494693.1 P-loop containing nucleoside triphosphate hydrolase protein [Zychaea mexicana]
MATAAVRVALRVRPLTQKETLCNSAETISFIQNEPQIYIGNEHSFTYDHVFDTKSHQQHIYSTSVQPLVEKYVDGFNATILAYGQTGSGKTYSMGTAIDGNTDSDDNQGTSK